MNNSLQKLWRHAAFLIRLAHFLILHPSTWNVFSHILFRERDGLKARLANFDKQYCAAADDASPSLPLDVNTRGYVIFAPNYTTTSAGVCCLYRLCDELNRRGYPAYITGAKITNPAMKASLIGRNQAKHLCANGFTAVYPEIIYGNPLAAKHVARWILNRPGLLGGDKQYDDAELVFNYSDAYTGYIHNRIAGKLYMPTIDQSIFFSDGHDASQRKLVCYYVGKSTWKNGYIDRDNAFEITRTTPAREELGQIFRNSRVLYCFDNSTILIYEAILCGCPVVVIPDGTHTKEDYQRLELGMDGIAWGTEELSNVRVDVAKLRARYEQVNRDYAVQLNDFIRITQNRAA